MARQTNPELDTKKVYISLPAEVYNALDSLAREQGRTTSNLGAFAIEHFLAYDAPKIYPLSKSIRGYQETDELD